MHLPQFIREHMEEILQEWEACAKEIAAPANGEMCEALRHHAESILQAIATELDPYPEGTRHDMLLPPEGCEPQAKPGSVPTEQQSEKLTPVQLSSEFLSLRTVVLGLWLDQVDEKSRETLDEVIRFSDAIDRVLAASMVALAERAQHSRDMFDAILGHDLRAPLASIAFGGDILTRPGISEQKAAEIGASIKRSARFMQGMVDDLLEFARTRISGGIPLKPQPVDVAELCEAAVHDASAMYPGHRFELSTHDSLDAQLDRHRLHQLLVNLLGNAAQHGAQDKPVRLLASGKGAHVDLRVSNEGKAIEKEHLECIFDPMVRLEPCTRSAAHVPSSLGLGLHIAREIAHSHGGSIKAQSTSKCTSFTVHLPRNVAQESNATTAVVPAALDSHRRVTGER